MAVKVRLKTQCDTCDETRLCLWIGDGYYCRQCLKDAGWTNEQIRAYVDFCEKDKPWPEGLRAEVV